MRVGHGWIETARRSIVELRRPGESGVSGSALWRLGQLAVASAIVAINVVGAVVVVILGTLVIPMPAVRNVGHMRTVNVVAAVVYVAVAVPLGMVIGISALFRLRDWLTEERPATALEQRLVLRAPLRLFVVQLALWLVAAAVFGVMNSRFSTTLAQRLAFAVALTGMSTAACAYLVTERLLRPAAARALATDAPERLAVPGVASRAVLSWALGTGVPVTGVLAIGAAQLTTPSTSPTALAGAMVVLGGIGLGVGLLAIGLAARATADPVDAVRHGLRRVQEGHFDTRVAVYDGTQLGQLQLGFNRMASGLAERERMREALGTYLDPEVADRVVKEGTDLAGEEVEVTVMFVDVRDFTAFAEGQPAREVVAALNSLFRRIVPVIHEQSGWIDKFVGDGLLAVFGAPRRVADHADRALAAAVGIIKAAESDQLAVGIGLNSGPVVAGNLGGAGRFGFTVIGDVVNTAARVEAATRLTGDNVLLAQSTKQRLTGPCPPLVERPDVALKGKSEPVSLFAVTPEPARRGGPDAP